MIIVHGGSIWIYLVIFILMIVLPSIIIFLLLKKIFFKKYLKKQKDRSIRLVLQIFLYLLALLLTFIIINSLQGVW